MPRENLRDSVLEALRSAKGSPLSKSQLSRGLKLPGTRVTELRNTLDALIKENLISEGKKGCFHIAGVPKNQLTGVLKFHPKGHAFFFPDITDEHNIATGIDFTINSRILIDRRNVGTSLDGDKVLVSIIKQVARPFRTRSEDRKSVV